MKNPTVTPLFSKRKLLIPIVVLMLFSLVVPLAHATDEAITNGSFETGLTAWNYYTDGFGTYDDFHISTDDKYLGNYGVHVPYSADGIGCLIIQNFTVPIEVESLLNFTTWVKGGEGDGTYWAGMVFNESGWITNMLVLGAAGSPSWTQLYLDDFSAYTGEKVSAITVTAYGGDDAGEDTYFDVVSLEVTEGAGSDWIDYEDPTGYTVTLNRLIEFCVPILVVLLPAALLCFITRRVDKWMILIGVTIGAGLGYYFGLVPMWIVFLVTIGLIGMAYQSVRGR